MTQQKEPGNKPKTAKRGVTLVEIAIVLVIVGLLLGGVLKGQELINNAKIRNIADRQNSLKVAWFAFIDRYQALPGDYVLAEQNIPGAGDRTKFSYPVGDGIIVEEESPLVFQNLTGAGFLRCPQCTAKMDATPSSDNSLVNSYGGIMAIFTNNYITPTSTPTQLYAVRGSSLGGPRLMAHSGPRIPSNITAEVDRKIDDGIANDGDVVFNYFDPTNANVPVLTCMSTNAAKQEDPTTLNSTDAIWWRHATAPVDQNCGLSIKL